MNSNNKGLYVEIPARLYERLKLQTQGGDRLARPKKGALRRIVIDALEAALPPRINRASGR